MNATDEIRGLEPDDRVRVTLDDGTEIVALVENEADVGPPLTPDGEASGWEEKWTLPFSHVEEDDGTDYESIDLSAEKRGGEWGSIYGQAWIHSSGENVNTAIEISDVEVL